MSIVVLCPSCNEENFGSALHCTKCQTSLVGVPRQDKPDSNPLTSLQQETEQAGAAATNAAAAQRIDILPSPAAGNYIAMLAEIRSWGMWSLGLGALHLITSGFLSAPWGILLVLVGLASFYFRSASMFVIYASTLAWAALSNVISFNAGWVAFGLYQFYLAYQVFQKYHLFRDAEENMTALENADSAANQTPPSAASRFFPWLAPAFGCFSTIAFVILVVAVFIVALASEGQATLPDYVGFIEGLIVNFGVLGIAIGAATLLSKYGKKGLAIAGIIGGVLTIVLEFALLFLP